MPLLRLLLVACALLAGESARAATATLPPLSGELAGGITTAFLPGAPPLKWKLALAAGATAERIVTLEVEGEGLRAKIEVHAASTDEVGWRLLESEIDLARWLPVLAPKYLPQLSGLVFAGRAAATGEGQWRGGGITGFVRFEIQDAAVHDAANTWSLTGVTMAGAFRMLPSLATDGAVKLAFREAGIAGVSVRGGEVEFSIDATEHVRVTRAKAALVEGALEVVPFEFDLRKPAVLTDVLFEHVELNRFASSLPSLLADARGPVSGRIAVSWSPGQGLKSASGALRPDPQKPVLIALAPAPGLLTAKIPPRLGGFMPGWLGWLFPAETPAYAELRGIESGETRLEITTIRVMVQPEGGPNGRTAQILIESAPAKHRRDVKSVSFEINVTGPLADFVKLMLEGNVKLHLR